MTKKPKPLPETRICKTCNKEFPATLEHFFPQKNTRIGLKSNCKTCQLEYNAKVKKNPYEPVVIKSFWRKYEEQEINAMTDEQVLQLIDQHLETYIKSWQSRNKGKDLPDLAKGTIADVRNKRTDAKKAPRIK